MNNYQPIDPHDRTAIQPDSSPHDEAVRGSLPPASADSGSPQQNAEERGNIQQPAEERGNLQQDAEGSGSLQQLAADSSEPEDRTEFHTLTTREVVRMFEDAGVPRSPRTISDWCDKTKRGDSKLDAYFDAAERKYYVTPESVGRAIKEEQMRAAKTSDHPRSAGPSFASDEGKPSGRQDGSSSRSKTQPDNAEEIEDMVKKISRLERDVMIKDAMIDHYERSQKTLVDRIETRSIEVGQLRSQVLSLKAGDQASPLTSDARIRDADQDAEEQEEAA